MSERRWFGANVSIWALSLCLASCSSQPIPASKSGPITSSNPGSVSNDGRLPHWAEPVHYALELTIDPRESSFSGRTRIDVELARAESSITLHGAELRIARASLKRADDSELTPANVITDAGTAVVALAFEEPVGPGRVQLQIEYTGSFDEHLRGLYRVESGGGAYAFTQFEPIHARQAFPCFDEPRFKTPFDVVLRVPAGAVAIANTRAVSTQKLPDGLVQVEFARTEKLPSYLVAFAVGPFDVVDADAILASSVRPSPLPLRGVTAQGRGAEIQIALGDTPRLLESLERYVGVAYPYDKLDLIAVPDFAAGAMENAGAITFRDTLLLMKSDSPEWQRRASISVNAHELAHQWFGNLVTMPWWDDIWLNEAFATWLSGRVLDEVHPEFHSEFARVAAFDRAMDVDSRASARQIRQPIESDHDIKNAFDAITYVKGSAVLGMFEKYLGEAAFQRGLGAYLAHHRFGSATSDDLMRALEQSSGRSVKQAFATFLEQPGVPSVNAELACTPGAHPRVRLRQARYVPLGSRAPRAGLWQVPVCVRHGVGRNDTAEQCTLLTSAEAELELAGQECPRWLLPNARAKGYYRWALSPKDFDALLAHGFEALGTGEQLSLLSNAEAAARSGALELDRLLAVTYRVGGQQPRELVQAALGVLVRLRESLFGEADLPAYRRLVRSLIEQRAHDVGLFPAPPGAGDTALNEIGDVKLLRPLLVGSLALEAKHDAIRRDLDRLGRARLGLAPDPRIERLPSELVEIALSVTVQVGGEPIVARVEAALATATDGIERGRLLAALGNNENPSLTPRILELSLSRLLRANERAVPIQGQLRQPSTRELAYGWVIEHYAALVERFGKENAAPLLTVANAFCSETKAEQAREFFAPRAAELPGGPRVLKLALENVEACAAFAKRHRESAKGALAKIDAAR